MAEELSRSLLEALVVGEFVARQPNLNENNLLKMLAAAGGVSAGRLTGRRVTDYVVSLRDVRGYILIKNFGLTTSRASSIMGRPDHSWTVKSSNHIKRIKDAHSDEIQDCLAERKPVLEARIRGGHSLKPAAVFHQRYPKEQLDDFRRRFDFYCGRIISQDFNKFSSNEKTWLRALFLYKILEGIDHMEEFSVLPLIESISGVKAKDIKSPRKYLYISTTRQIACYAFRNLCMDMSYPEIASVLGGKDHTSAIAACRNVWAKLEENAELLQYIMNINPTEGAGEETVPPGNANGRISEALALAERLMGTDGITADNLLETACKITGTRVNEVRYGDSSRETLTVKMAVSYVGRERFGIDFSNIAEMLDYMSDSKPRDHFYVLKKQFSKETKT